MGCDIHMIAQVRKEGGWETLTSWPQWEVVYRDEAGQFLTDVLPRLKAAGKPEDVRIVFGFDS